MGGHGGLNILPQKKWNVYNWDNRIKVEKDKRLAKEKQQKEDQEDHDDQARDRIRKLKQKQKQRSRSVSPKQSGLNEELKIIQQQNKPINLFEKEEEIINQKENVKAQIELSKEFFKDKPFDLSSKFLGSFAEDSKPWYAKAIQRPKSDVQEVIKEQINEFKNQSQTYYTILDVDKKQKQKVEAKNNISIKDIKIEDNHDKEKDERKRLKKLQKLGLKLKEMLGSDAESSQDRKSKKDFEKQKLRKERLARERQEYYREKKLLDETKFS